MTHLPQYEEFDEAALLEAMAGARNERDQYVHRELADLGGIIGRVAADRSHGEVRFPTMAELLALPEETEPAPITQKAHLRLVVCND
jgi:hypothetical protein